MGVIYRCICTRFMYVLISEAWLNPTWRLTSHSHTHKHTVVVSPVYVALLMDGVDGKNHLRHVELGHVLRQPVLKFTKQRQQVTANVIIHHQVLQEETLSSLITQHHSITQTQTQHFIISNARHQRAVRFAIYLSLNHTGRIVPWPPALLG